MTDTMTEAAAPTPGASSLPQTIDEAVEALDDVVDEAARQGDRMGFFPALYRTVTASVRQGIQDGFFEDGPRMERFDVAFASLYFEALHARRRGGTPSRCWQVAFDGCRRERPLILQHLLTGMNAHINLDLGIAAARTAPGEALPSLRGDFDRINEVLASTMEEIRSHLGEVSPWLGLLDRLGGAHDDAILRFSIQAARSEAWWFANELAPLKRAHWSGPINVRDRRVAPLGREILDPGLLNLPLLAIRLNEEDDVSTVLRVLGEAEPLDFDTLEARVQEGASLL